MDAQAFKQIHEQEYIKGQLGREVWLTVYQQDEQDDSRSSYWCALAPLKIPKKQILSSYSWNLLYGCSAFSLYEEKGNYVYHRYLETGWEPLIYERRFDFGFETIVELAEEFRLFYALIPKKDCSNLYYIQEDGQLDEVVRFEHQKIRIKKLYLTHYLMIKKMRLVLFFEFDKYADSDEVVDGKPFTEIDVNEEPVRYNLHYGCYGVKEGKNRLSRLIGKKIIEPASKITLNIWHLMIQPETAYEEFIIGQDEDGEAIKFSCDPDQLANYFGKNQENPHYVTPVFFSKDVMNRYYSNSDRYTVSDAYIMSKGSWILRLDNHHADYVVAYLGDLGRDLTAQERKYWLAHNILPEERTLSKVKYERDFLGAWSNPEFIEHRFKQEFEMFQKAWKKKYSWFFFKPLYKKDEHHFSGLRLPLNETQREFDEQVLSLTKLLIDSLNESKIAELVSNKELLKDAKGQMLKGIGKLDAVFREKGLTDAAQQIKFLRNLQTIRSISTAHRKSESDFEKEFAKLNPNDLPLPQLFERLLEQANEFLAYLSQQFIE